MGPVWRNVILSLFLSSALLAHSEEVNNGEDVTRPVQRVDLRLKLQRGVDTVLGNAVIATARTDQLYHLPCGWQFSLRADLPYEWFSCSQRSHPKCYSADRCGDSLLQTLLVTPTYGPWTYAFGFKWIFPTAGTNLEIGNGKYQILPSIGFKYDLGHWRKGAYFTLLFRQANDYAGYHVPHLSRLYIQPTLNINLRDDWFVTFSPEIRYDWIVHEWFVPFDMMIGKMITPHIVVSVEFEAEIGRISDPEFQQEVEFRIGYFF